MNVAGPFFGGMEANREELMGKRPHWMLEMLGVHEDYQNQGIPASQGITGSVTPRSGLIARSQASQQASSSGAPIKPIHQASRLI